MSIKTRLRALEVAQPVKFLGWRYFNTADGENYYEVNRGDFRESLICADGNNPTDRRAWTSAELEALLAEGWRIIPVHWVKDWRAVGIPSTQDSGDMPE